MLLTLVLLLAAMIGGLACTRPAGCVAWKDLLAEMRRVCALPEVAAEAARDVSAAEWVALRRARRRATVMLKLPWQDAWRMARVERRWDRASLAERLAWLSITRSIP